MKSTLERLLEVSVIVVLMIIVWTAWISHTRDNAARDATIAVQKSEIAKVEESIAADRQLLSTQLAVLKKQNLSLASQPGRAPIVIRETVPLSTPLKQTAEITKETLPDAPVAQITKQQEVELAQFGNSCKECSLEREQLKSESADKQQVIERQKVEIDAAVKAAKGGSVWQRTTRILKWIAIAGGTGYVLGRSHR